jgi:hypothetical protein
LKIRVGNSSDDLGRLGFCDLADGTKPRPAIYRIVPSPPLGTSQDGPSCSPRTGAVSYRRRQQKSRPKAADQSNVGMLIRCGLVIWDISNAAKVSAWVRYRAQWIVRNRFSEARLSYWGHVSRTGPWPGTVPWLTSGPEPESGGVFLLRFFSKAAVGGTVSPTYVPSLQKAAPAHTEK